MNVKKKRAGFITGIVIVMGMTWLYMLGKTLYPTFSTKLRVKEDILSMVEEENENRVVHLVKTNNSLIRIEYEKINSILYRYSTRYKTTIRKDIIVEYFAASPDDECFVWGCCKNADIETIVFTFPDETELQIVPNEEGIFLQSSKYEPLDAKQILGYTDTGETIDVLEYILNVY